MDGHFEMQKILILSQSSQEDFELTHVSSNAAQYTIFNDLEYAAGYLYACKREYRPDLILIDHDLNLIEKFISLSREINIDLSQYKLVTHIGEEYCTIDAKKHAMIHFSPLTESELSRILPR